MDIERMSYIFGSFTRRRQSQEVGTIHKRRSIESTKTTPSHDRSLSTPHTTTTSKKDKIASYHSNRAKSVCAVNFDENKFKCPMCKKFYVEPRVLTCLHTFCLKCLQMLQTKDQEFNWQDDQSEDSNNTIESPKGSGSGGSGYTSDKNISKPTSPSRQPDFIFCPTCGIKSEIPDGGVLYYPPNYILQNKMVLATLNAQQTHLLCDLCPSEISATSRCMDCAISFCHQCEQIHLRQKAFSNHNVLGLDEARKIGITKVRRQIMCLIHPEMELSIYCTNCSRVVCKECIPDSHKDHICEPVSRAIKSHLTRLRLIVDKAKSIAEQSAFTANRLHFTTKKIEAHCGKIHSDVEIFMENYIRSLEEHRQNLLDQIQKTKSEQLEQVDKCKLKLHRRVREARDVAYFLEELLNEGTDVEIMSFVKFIGNKIETSTNFKKFEDIIVPESIQFFAKEIGKCDENLCPLYGLITTQTIAPENCTLNTEGLNNLRIGKKIEMILETRDRSDNRIQRGGEEILAEIRYRDAGVSKLLNVDIEDCRDGTYRISFIPDVSGKLILNINIRGLPIKDSPFPIIVRSLKPHHGTFHCCSFCSSGGSKEASCGCGGKMPGGYRGCGHGHDGHPGKRHWSCCGNTLEHSECSRVNQHLHYQFTY